MPSLLSGSAFALAMVAALLNPTGGAVSRAAEGQGALLAAPGTTIVIGTDRPGIRASRRLLGVNHHYYRDGYGIWSEVTDAPRPGAVAGTMRARVQAIRFPGGTIANLYDWKRAIGTDRPCQRDGNPNDSGLAIRARLGWGPDEYMEFLAATHSAPLIMVPFVRGTPADAADWVEYMNAPAGVAGNPHGGTDWADRRAANGHLAPYAVKRWEIGNEQDHIDQRYWMAADPAVAVRQYANGAKPSSTHERLGKDCDHLASGVASDGSAGQVFEVAYPPVVASSVQVTVGDQLWHRIATLSAAGASERAYVVRPGSGEIVFGDGVHGAIPADGVVPRASYTGVHSGFFSFAAAMHDVDPTIDVCSSWGHREFVQVAGSRRYDCLTTHAISSFGPGGGVADWSSPLEGHDAFIQAADRRIAGMVRLLGDLPRSKPLWLTEFSTIRGDGDTYPSWATSASHAVHMASLWAGFLRSGIALGTGDDLTWGTDRAVLGPEPDFTFTADATTREGIAPIFEAGGRVLPASVSGNPLRRPASGDAYRALVVTGTRLADGTVFVLVINRMPFTDVTAAVLLDGFTSRGRASVRAVTCDGFQDWNHPGLPPDVTLTTWTREIGVNRFTHTFPATSTTLLRIPAR